MARPLRIEYEDAFYHVIQRGIERRNIFTRDADKNRFLSYLEQAHTGYAAIFHTYILMNNHYHIILKTPKANLTKVIHFLNTSYAVYYNTKYKRVGPLYQGRYKAILVQEDEYLHHLSRYIHLNPVRIKIAKDPIEYPWSSYKYFISNDKCPRFLDTAFILSMFDNNTSQARKLYREFVIDGIGMEKKIITENTISSFILGNYSFLKKIEKRFLEAQEDSEIPQLNQLKQKRGPSLDYIKQLVYEKVTHNARLQRKLAIYLSRKYTQKTLRQIADFYGKIKYPAISKVFKRTGKERELNRSLDKLLLHLEKKINV